MIWKWFRSRVNIWVILGALAVSGALIAVLVGFLYFYPLPSSVTAQTNAMLTVIPAPTLTPTPLTATAAPTDQAGSEVIDGIGIGLFVQIAGTEGDGLRLRSGPSTGDDPRFLGYESEVFLVKDGPRFSDDFTWWFLEAPYDPSRSGWAVAKFLAVVGVTPVPTP